jgi:hypothetical protein
MVEYTLGHRLLVLWVTGGLSGVSALGASDEVLTIRRIVGRFASSGMMGIGSSIIWIRFPDVEFISVLGIDVLLGAMGVQIFSKIVEGLLKKRLGG